jgi:signal transduction histidine kinase
MTTLERMINQVIDVSAIISTQFHLDMEPFNLVYLIKEQIAAWQPDYAKRQLTLSFEDTTHAQTIEGDRYRLGQTLDHLLRNAHSYTLPGGKITIHTRNISDSLEISIEDTGVGIDADEIDAVFERLYRGRSANAGPTDARGLGLGLTLSKQIIEAHHGTIQLKSRPQVGTTVIVTLPIMQKADARSTAPQKSE